MKKLLLSFLFALTLATPCAAQLVGVVGGEGGKKIVAVNTNAAQFTSASSQRLGVTNTLLDVGDENWTAVLWVYLDNLTGVRTFIAKDDNTNRTFGILLNDATDEARAYITRSGVGTNGVNATTFGALSTATWYFIAVKFDTANLCISVNNGTFDCVADTINPLSSTSEFTLGAPSSGNTATGLDFLDGRMQSVGFAKSVISAADLTSLYNGGTPKGWCQLSGAEQVLFTAWWDLGEASGTRFDSTANNLDLTDFNAVTQTTGSRTGNCN